MNREKLTMHPDAQARFAMLDQMVGRRSLKTLPKTDGDVLPVVQNGSQASQGGGFPLAELPIRLASE